MAPRRASPRAPGHLIAYLALFDVDGTLFLTPAELSRTAMVGSLEEIFGVSLPNDPVARVNHAGQTSKRIAREILRLEGLDDAEIDEGLDRWCSRFAETYVELLARADTSRWEDGGGPRATQRVRHSPCAPDRQSRTGRAGAHGAVRPEETVAVGDTSADVAGAHEAGVRSIVISSRRSSAEAFRGADAVVNDMASVAGTVLAWAGRPDG